MGRYTCAYNCEHASDSDVKYFKFPLYSPRKLKRWLSSMKWPGWTPSRFSVLCISHFEEQHIDRTGKSVTLKEDAVPTKFPSVDDAQKRKMKAPVNPRGKRFKTAGAKASPASPAQPPGTGTGTGTGTGAATAKRSGHPEPGQTEQPAGEKDPRKWRIIVDERLMKIESFPHFFHGDYCVPLTESEDPEKVIEVREPWEWLGLDVRGPLPQTLNGHRYLLTVTDYFSKWVEAVPMESCLPSNVAAPVVDVVAHFGYPIRILSRLPHDVVHKINRELQDQLKVTVALVVYHRQTGAADRVTQQLIDRMVNGLVEEHAADWDVYLPAQVFSLCFKEHPKTKERPFSALCCKGPEPVRSPRGANFDCSRIQESAFVVR
ncbi:uncharacterized protein zgc:153292 [Brachionichthys hirsutus]|uniref:uncharacterized protein zgc:153292 n=1 Tax=Brachionichthys hirsutus TaxID=412623 RepID=UPI003604BEE5